MIQYQKVKQKFSIILLLFILAHITGYAQKVNQTQPVWWFGASAAANINSYRGTTQMLNENLSVPTAFHKGHGVRPYISLLTEYRPNKRWGGILNLAYDNRGGKFNGVTAPCDCPATLKTNISYFTVEPSLRFIPLANAFYVFAGPTLNFNLSKSFTYTQEKQTDTKGNWSDIRKIGISGQLGAGIDLPISAPTSTKQMSLSPFVSFQTDFGHAPRSVESWSFYTTRIGVAFKFTTPKKPSAAQPVSIPLIVIEKEIQFSVRAPKVVPLNRKVKETFPLRN
jgi:hypothetical protein